MEDGAGADPMPLRNKHPLEKLDSHHRCGPNLKLYEALCRTISPLSDFFKWLDEGEGKFLNHPNCSRTKLDEERVSYLNESEIRRDFEVAVAEGKLKYKIKGGFVDTQREKYIYVLSPRYELYVGKKEKGKFHHSSFLAGEDVLCAGYLRVCRGKIEALSWRSGHYKPNKENFQLFQKFLEEAGVEVEEVISWIDTLIS